MSCITQSFLQERIDATKAAIEAAENAEAAILGGTIQSYTLDDGQSRQTVTKANITELRNYINSLYNRYSTLCARKSGGNTVIVRPGY